jgi:signal transduction histidine kinase/FixJ family two-component response regulator
MVATSRWVAVRIAVLVVDDSEDDALLMMSELGAAGFDPMSRRVETAGSMATALGEQPWDMILADYRMPQFTGMRALEVLKQSRLDIPFILVSGTVGEEVAVAMMKAGANDFVLKHRLTRLGAAVARELRDAEVRRERRRAEAALEILADAGKLAVEVLDLDTIVKRAAELLVPRLADWCIVYARDPTGMKDESAVACCEGVERAALEELARRYPLEVGGEPSWFGATMQTRQPTLISTVRDEDLATLARDEEQLRLLRRLEPRSLVIIPQVARDRVVGLVVLATRRPGRYTVADVDLARELGARFALVVENARLSRAREEFITTAIHEIKTPLAVIKTSVEVAARLTPAQREARFPELLARLDRQVDRMTRLVSDVLEVSRLDRERAPLARHPTDLAALVQNVVDRVRSVSPRHRLVIERNDPITLDVDPDRIEQVLTDLLANAVKYSPGGGDVEIESRRRDGAVQVAVHDHGIGIPKNRQARVFERFYRAHAGTSYEHASSLGVGLHLAQELIRRHGGTLWFESTEGVGSTFGFTLPTNPEESR